MKNTEYYMKLPYTVMVTKEADNEGADHYYARILEFPCLGDGDTPQEALECLNLHMRMAIEAYLKDGITIPEPQTEFSGNINIRVDPALHADLSKEAAAYNMSLNKYTSLILERRQAAHIGMPKDTKRKKKRISIK